jgi:hypothetical protein
MDLCCQVYVRGGHCGSFCIFKSFPLQRELTFLEFAQQFPIRFFTKNDKNFFDSAQQK